MSLLKSRFRWIIVTGVFFGQQASGSRDDIVTTLPDGKSVEFKRDDLFKRPKLDGTSTTNEKYSLAEYSMDHNLIYEDEQFRIRSRIFNYETCIFYYSQDKPQDIGPDTEWITEKQLQRPVHEVLIDQIFTQLKKLSVYTRDFSSGQHVTARFPISGNDYLETGTIETIENPPSKEGFRWVVRVHSGPYSGHTIRIKPKNLSALPGKLSKVQESRLLIHRYLKKKLKVPLLPIHEPKQSEHVLDFEEAKRIIDYCFKDGKVQVYNIPKGLEPSAVEEIRKSARDYILFEWLKDLPCPVVDTIQRHQGSVANSGIAFTRGQPVRYDAMSKSGEIREILDGGRYSVKLEGGVTMVVHQASLTALPCASANTRRRLLRAELQHQQDSKREQCP